MSIPPNYLQSVLCSSRCPGTVTAYVLFFSSFPLDFVCWSITAAEDLPDLYDPSATIDHVPCCTAVRKVSFVSSLIVLVSSGRYHGVLTISPSCWLWYLPLEVIASLFSWWYLIVISWHCSLYSMVGKDSSVRLYKFPSPSFRIVVWLPYVPSRLNFLKYIPRGEINIPA